MHAAGEAGDRIAGLNPLALLDEDRLDQPLDLGAHLDAVRRQELERTARLIGVGDEAGGDQEERSSAPDQVPLEPLGNPRLRRAGLLGRPGAKTLWIEGGHT